MYSYIDEDRISKQLQCCICLNPFTEPYQHLTCQNKFCLQCLNNLPKQIQKCPYCREDLQQNQIQKVTDRTLINILNELKVRCNKCEKIIERHNYNRHSCIDGIDSENQSLSSELDSFENAQDTFDNSQNELQLSTTTAEHLRQLVLEQEQPAPPQQQLKQNLKDIFHLMLVFIKIILFAYLFIKLIPFIAKILFNCSTPYMLVKVGIFQVLAKRCQQTYVTCYALIIIVNDIMILVDLIFTYWYISFILLLVLASIIILKGKNIAEKLVEYSQNMNPARTLFLLTTIGVILLCIPLLPPSIFIFEFFIKSVWKLISATTS
ncbi:unnamed protein product [Didymodactylos carnosus]|uniref:RING-type domain-containing protein n=1 Tax=Didymodactylos carnosus TaxID=1234261 RepID=A0A8S2DNB0_9BILA|nr:unnamed protein product [Didymodactylos carnosus]CAF3756942.1 unnamed protein product [Didymodactylos carnosus]